MELQIVSDIESFVARREEWQALYEACPTARLPLHWTWLHCWWQHYGEACARPGGLRVVLGWHEGELVAAAPLYWTRPRGRFGVSELRPWSSGEDEADETCAEYLDPLAREAFRVPFLSALAEALQAGRLGAGDRLIWPFVSDADALTAALPAARAESAGDCYLLDFPAGFESYLSQFSGASRHKYRRVLRDITANNLTFAIARETAEAQDFFEEMVELHQARWTAVGEPGCYDSPRFLAFHRQLVAQLVPYKELVLGRLSRGSHPLAVVQGFRHGDKIDWYQSGVRFQAVIRSPGTSCYLACLRELADGGLTTADYLTGDADYKSQLATRRHHLWTVTADYRWRAKLTSALGRR